MLSLDSLDARISLRDAAACMQLVDECQELRWDPRAWREHLADGVEKIVGGAGTLFAVSVLTANGPEIQTGYGSWERDAGLKHTFSQYCEAGGMKLMPELPIITPRILRDRNLIWRQSELVSRKVYRRSAFYQDFMRWHHIEDMMAWTVLRPEGVVGMSIARSANDRRFSSRDEACMTLIAQGITQRLEKTAPQRRAWHALTPRLRSVLAELLMGHSNKEIARRLGLRPSTVHEYTLAIYRQFGVRSRARLQALFLEGRALLDVGQ